MMRKSTKYSALQKNKVLFAPSIFASSELQFFFLPSLFLKKGEERVRYVTFHQYKSNNGFNDAVVGVFFFLL